MRLHAPIARSAAFAVILFTVAVARGADAPIDLRPPSERYGELFDRVQRAGLYADSKTFADAVPNESPERIVAAYLAQRPDDASLRAFVAAHFTLPEEAATHAPPAARTLRAQIAALWPQLLRPALPADGGSRLAFDTPHVVPGGRFRELYYWDSYFTMLGLRRDGHEDTVNAMVDGFAGLVARYGHIPNGTRTYYLSRSQPPFFWLMAALTEPDDPAAAWARLLPALRAEHAWWMRGAAGLPADAAAEHVVRLPDGSLLNRWWDARAAPRDESYREDVALAAAGARPAPALYRDLRAAAESGWDFSSRWFADGRNLATIETTALVAVDLNSLLYGLETAIAQGCARVQDIACMQIFDARAAVRRAAMDRWLWDAACGCYADWQWQRHARSTRLSAATLYPLFVGAAAPAQARAVATTVRARLLLPGGLATTTVVTGQQWDRPNGWAPLQWIAIAGLRRYGETALADEIARRWLQTVMRTFTREHRLVEKYDLEAQGGGSGGEYPLQDGFGWTNGVTRALLDDAGARP
ncbi:alpha,alpha-trehalase TreF [Solimonas soli]|uniref:alpha,alpha-trehalase TreF n=1 Tax=Solimonas soli TaxID=413479 RepID=UPI000484200E|nr:alpha,alpha-trehalase TreF [Solimonas soli]